MRYLKSKLNDLLIYFLGLISAGYLIYNSCDAIGIDVAGFIPAIFCLGAIIHAIIFRMKLL